MDGGAAEEDKFLLTSPDKVVATLLELSRRPDLITATFNGGTECIITTVVNVLPEHGLVLLEYGTDHDRNNRLLAADSAICQGKHHDIAIRFRLNGLRSARYQGEQLLAALIPETLWRFQRREFFRVHTPLINPVCCRLIHTTSGELTLPLADLSIGCLSLLDEGERFSGDRGDVLKGCTLTFPMEGNQVEVALEVRSRQQLAAERERGGQRIGCAFVGLNQRDATFLQRYVNQLQLQQHKLARN